MINIINTVGISAFILSLSNVLLNFYLIFSIFILKKVPKKADWTLIYCRFVVDMFYSLDTTTYLGYFLIRLVDPTIVIKNLAFYIAWPNFNLGTMRCWIVFFIGLDRVLATCAPISYHNNRSKIPTLAFFLFILSYTVFEYYILLVLCSFELDVPLDCTIFRCAVGTCYHDYWKWYQQIMYSFVGFLSIILFFRLFIWNSFTKNVVNKTISRATRISLLDSFIIFAFDFFPVFLTAQWPQYNTTTVGPLGSLCKSLGFVIESTIICHVLIGGNNKVAPTSMINIVTTVSLSALIFAFCNVLLNLNLLYIVFWKSKIPKNTGILLIYFRFAIDLFYSFDTSVHLAYYLVRVVSPDLAVKNLAFYIAWPNYIFGSFRSWDVLFITTDRVLATCIPIFYHLHRSKVPFLAIPIFILAYVLFEQYVLFGICNFVIDIPIECSNFSCTVNKCYHDYWKWYEQMMHVCVGTLSIVLCFRLFVWNNCSHTASNKVISRATRISLLDSFIIFAFDLLPISLMANFPEINFRSVGPLSALCKSLGFVIESIITCRVLVGKNQEVVPASNNRTMINFALTVALSALIFSFCTVLFNCYFLLIVFWKSKIFKNSSLILIYFRFAIDVFFSLDTSIHLAYYLIRIISPDLVFKNLSFYIGWPHFVLGSFRSWVALFITVDRILATFVPIFYHLHRSKVSLFVLSIFIFVYVLFEQYVLFGICTFVIDIPLECRSFNCIVNECYLDYWKWYEQLMNFSVGTLSIILCFRLFIWNHCSQTASNELLSRATLISLLDSFIFFVFCLLPVFLMTHFPEVTFQSVGPLNSLCRSIGFVIESVITFGVLKDRKEVTVVVPTIHVL
ncbi:CRE-SRBC-50 protein [Caenorhabditis remanei]|uniref:CRE-SRBC-50 protein n=1 Tax=Caenorhabditis remanei TaxID=31234 RepID=E3LL20_CAERE|nr:CRE-SRBC-50 protein [Caenorhabditis remanei]